MIRPAIAAAAVAAAAALLSSCAGTPAEEARRTAVSARVEETLSRMTDEEKVAQLFVVTSEQLADGALTEATDALSEAAKEFPVGGFILFARHIAEPSQLRALNKALASLTPIPPMIAVDEEGGRVARLARNENFFLPTFRSMEDVGATGDPENARGAGQAIGGYLRSFGFTVDFAPVADVNTNPDNIVIGDRAFGSDPELVAEMDGAFLRGLSSAGIRGCLKHFPGHGDTKGDTHKGFVSVDRTWEELKARELIPFTRNLERSPAVMVAHVTLTKATTDGLPASLSRQLIEGRLRGELGYEGLVLTDALDMGAITERFGAGEACVMAFEAGNDVLLMPKDFREAYSAVLSAVRSGRISRERLDGSVARILAFKGL